MTALTNKLADAGPVAAAEAIQQLWKGPTAETIPKLPGRFFAPAAIATPALKAAAEATADVVQISSDQLAVKLKGHGKGSRPLKPQDVALVQAILTVDRKRRSGRSLIYTALLADGWWELAIKVAQGGKELLISTLHPVGERRIRRFEKR